VSGQEKNPPLVLLPGGNNTSLMWWQNIEALSQHYRTFALDNIADFGLSIPNKDIKKPNEFTDWLNELFNALGLKEGINIVGLSYGGWVASLYALQSQSRLKKMVLLAPAATVFPLCKEFWVRVIFSALIPHRYFTKSLINWICEDMSRKNEATRAILKDAVDDLYTGIRSFKPRKLPIPTVLADRELQSISVSTLYLVGRNEKIYSAKDAVQRLNNIAPKIITEIIPESGHDLVFVQPDFISRKILEFLK
jgi:pimeloyl-ACP methyl ester carboxylesterase